MTSAIKITIDQLRAIIEYIETSEVQIDGEWGLSRTLEELIKAEEYKMPDFYFELKEKLEIWEYENKLIENEHST